MPADSLIGEPFEVPQETPAQRIWRLADEGTGGYAWTHPQAGRMDWHEVRGRARMLAAELAQTITPGDRVAIVAMPCWQWKVLDIAVQAAGGVTVPVHPVLTRTQIDTIIEDSGAVRVYAGSDAPRDHSAWIPLESIDDIGPGEAPEVDRAVAQQGDGPALIVYTSGTTGTPKGAVLSRSNITAATASYVEHLGMDKVADPTFVAFLPLAHVAGYIGLETVTWVDGRITFSRPDRFVQDLAAVQPTLFGGVPRVFDRIITKVEDVALASPLRKRLYLAAKKTAIAVGAAREDGGQVPPVLAAQHAVFERLVYGPLRKRLGFGRLLLGLTGAATARPDLLRLLQGMGINVIEAYGLTETTAVTCSNRFTSYHADSVGVPLPGTRIALADDGEVLVSGPTVFSGYHGRDDEGLFSDMDGRRWLRTGDIGEIRDGALSIIDRKKELLVLDTGKNVAPTPIEDRIIGLDALVEDAMLIGDGRPATALLIQPDYDRLIQIMRDAGGPLPVTVEAGKDPTGADKTYGVDAHWTDSPLVRRHFEELIERLNAELAPHEQVRSWTLVPHAFTLTRGELTPTFKKRRQAILESHGDQVQALYA